MNSIDDLIDTLSSSLCELKEKVDKQTSSRVTLTNVEIYFVERILEFSKQLKKNMEKDNE
jgi:hypothetical protein